jgi:hypothetical protein
VLLYDFFGDSTIDVLTWNAMARIPAPSHAHAPHVLVELRALRTALSRTRSAITLVETRADAAPAALLALWRDANLVKTIDATLLAMSADEAASALSGTHCVVGA